MRYFAQVGLLVLVAAVAGNALAVLHRATLEDAYLDFLDPAAVKQVSDYMASTEYFRSAGYAMLLVFWSVFVLGVDRVAGLAFKSNSPLPAKRVEVSLPSKRD